MSVASPLKDRVWPENIYFHKQWSTKMQYPPLLGLSICDWVDIRGPCLAKHCENVSKYLVL